MHPYRAATALLLYSFAALVLSAQASPQPGTQDVRPKDVREIAKGGSNALPQLQELLKNPRTDVRLEAVKQITGIGSGRCLDALIQATRDNDPKCRCTLPMGW